MSRSRKWTIAAALLLAGVFAAGFFAFLRHGFSAREKPWAVEAFVARRLRRLAIPRAASQVQNPLPLTPELLAESRAHFADHCATCHANDASGNTAMGPNFYPPVPDMRLPATQELSDGELFYIIENGIRFTGMPAWGTESLEDDADSWGLVHFIRHLPQISPEELEEMESLNPKSRREIEEEQEVRRFLEGGEAPEAKPSQHKH